MRPNSSYFRSGNDDLESSFVVQCVGQVKSGNLDNQDYLYCRYFFTCGDDWDIVGGLDNGLSQIACHNHLTVDGTVVWNFPLDISFKSTNVHGWPRIAIGVYGIDFFGRDVIRGYGSALVPLQAGLHTITVDMYRPLANSSLNQLASWFMGNPPEVTAVLRIFLNYRFDWFYYFCAVFRPPVRLAE